MFLQKSSEIFTDQITNIEERNHHYKHAGQTERDLEKYYRSIQLYPKLIIIIIIFVHIETFPINHLAFKILIKKNCIRYTENTVDKLTYK